MKTSISIFPKTLLAVALVILAQFCLGLFVRKTLLWPILGLDLLLLLACGLDLLVSHAEPFEIDQEFREVLSVGEPNRISIVLRKLGGRALTLELTRDLPFRAHAPELPARLTVSPRKPCEFVYHVIPEERGAASLGAYYARYSSRLGLFTFEARVPFSDEIRVYPNLRAIVSFELLLRRHLQAAQVRTSLLRGGASEFARLRDYTTDDDFRSVDWKATARRNVLTSREYQLESDQNLMLVIDSGRLMTAQAGGLAQFDHALNAALLLAHVASRAGDRAGLLCFDEEPSAFMAPESGVKATQKMIRTAYALKPRLAESSYLSGLGFLHQKIKQRALIVLFTQVIDDSAAAELLSQIRLLKARHLPLVVILEDTDLSHELSRTDDLSADAMYRKGAAAELALFRNQVISQLKQGGALVLESAPEHLGARLINRYLELKARRSIGT